MSRRPARVQQGPVSWDHHPDCGQEIGALKSVDRIAWATLRNRLRVSQQRPLTRKEHKFPMRSATETVGHLPIDETANPESYVRFYFGEHDEIVPVLGLSVAIKPSTYDELGEDETRDLQNEHIADACDRYITHPEVLRKTAI